MKAIERLTIVLTLIIMTVGAKAQNLDSTSLVTDTITNKLDTIVSNLDSTAPYLDTLDHNSKQTAEEIRLRHQVDSLINLLKLTESEKDLLQHKISYQLESINNLEDQIRLLQQTINNLEQKERFSIEKSDIYKEAKEKEVEYLRNSLNERNEDLKAEKETNAKLNQTAEKYRLLNDSLKNSLTDAEKKIIQTNEALKYTQQRAKDAEAKVEAATSKKKKVVPIQGLALKFFRTPNWSIAPDQIEDGTIVYRIVNKNGGDVEFDYTAGASVMLWDLTRKDKNKKIENDTLKKHIEIKKFDQEFSYSLGLYVGFGGKNLFKNFYVGPSFKFLDFFHLTAGLNICEYEMLTGNFQEGDILPTGLSLTDQISKVWKPKPFVSLSFDLDFLSYIK